MFPMAHVWFTGGNAIIINNFKCLPKRVLSTGHQLIWNFQRCHNATIKLFLIRFLHIELDLKEAINKPVSA